MPININQLLQYMSGAGAALSQGQQIAPALNQITQQNITAQSYAGLLQKILSGGGKMTIDKDKFSLSGSPDLLSPGADQVQSGDPTSQGFGGTQAGVAQRQAPPPQAAPTGQQDQGIGFLQRLLNPQQAL